MYRGRFRASISGRFGSRVTGDSIKRRVRWFILRVRDWWAVAWDVTEALFAPFGARNSIAIHLDVSKPVEVL